MVCARINSEVADGNSSTRNVGQESQFKSSRSAGFRWTLSKARKVAKLQFSRLSRHVLRLLKPSRSQAGIDVCCCEFGISHLLNCRRPHSRRVAALTSIARRQRKKTQRSPSVGD